MCSCEATIPLHHLQRSQYKCLVIRNRQVVARLRGNMFVERKHVYNLYNHHCIYCKYPLLQGIYLGATDVSEPRSPNQEDRRTPCTTSAQRHTCGWNAPNQEIRRVPPLVTVVTGEFTAVAQQHLRFVEEVSEPLGPRVHER